MSIKKALTLSVCVTAVCLLMGCSAGAHQVISANEACGSCHSTEKPQYDVADPVNAIRVQSGQELHVNPGGDPLVLCTPIFTSEDGSAFVPVMYRNLSSGEAVDIALEDGTWVLAADLGDASRSRIVVVDPDLTEPGEADITL